MLRQVKPLRGFVILSFAIHVFTVAAVHPQCCLRGSESMSRCSRMIIVFSRLLNELLRIKLDKALSIDPASRLGARVWHRPARYSERMNIRFFLQRSSGYA